MNLRKYGQFGCGYLPKRIAPALEKSLAITPTVLNTMLVHNPQRLLARP